jgi:hypothetical protein
MADTLLLTWFATLVYFDAGAGGLCDDDVASAPRNVVLQQAGDGAARLGLAASTDAVGQGSLASLRQVPGLPGTLFYCPAEDTMPSKAWPSLPCRGHSVDCHADNVTGEQARNAQRL